MNTRLDEGQCSTCSCAGGKFPDSGYKSSLAIYNCDWPESFDCYTSVKLKKETQPKFNEQGIKRVNINPDFGLPKARQFVEMNSGSCGPNKKQFFSPNDPRLVDPMRSIKMSLDTAPYSSDLPIEEIYTDKVYERPTYYPDYEHIHSGQIQYYYDKTDVDPYSYPNYVLRANVDYNLFKDPMGSLKPEYIRKPLLFTNSNISKDTRTQDTLTFREDISERLSRTINQTDYKARYYS